VETLDGIAHHDRQKIPDFQYMRNNKPLNEIDDDNIEETYAPGKTQELEREANAKQLRNQMKFWRNPK
jgi:hypothetical protein